MKKSFSTKQAHIIASALRADYATGIIKPEYLIVMPDGKRYAVAQDYERFVDEVLESV